MFHHYLIVELDDLHRIINSAAVFYSVFDSDKQLNPKQNLISMGNLNQSDSMVLLDAHYTGNRAQSKAK